MEFLGIPLNSLNPCEILQMCLTSMEILLVPLNFFECFGIPLDPLGFKGLERNSNECQRIPVRCDANISIIPHFGKWVSTMYNEFNDVIWFSLIFIWFYWISMLCNDLQSYSNNFNFFQWVWLRSGGATNTYVYIYFFHVHI